MQSLMPPVDLPNNEFSDGNPGTGALGSPVPALFMNNVQSAIRAVEQELLSILSAANINPDGDNHTQVLQAINQILINTNVAMPYGIPLPWPLSTPPAGYLTCNGASFNAAVYPNLATIFSTGVLPDLRGQTIKGLPASGRALLSAEADGIKSHGHSASASTYDYGTLGTTTNGNHTHTIPGNIMTNDSVSFHVDDENDMLGVTWSQNKGINGAGDHAHTTYIGPHGHTITVNATGNTENTVKNIAFNFIVRAA